jgi:hypothetical protein
MITQVTPGDGGSIGCHTRFSATVTGHYPISSVEAVFIDDPRTTGAGGARTLFLTRSSTGSDLFESAPINGAVSSILDPIRSGHQRVSIRATDAHGGTSAQTLSIDVQLAVPNITQLSPSALGAVSSPVAVQVAATSTAGAIVSIHVAAVPQTAGQYMLSHAVDVGTIAGDHGSVMLDPTGFANGPYILYAAPMDAVGNALEPYDPIQILVSITPPLVRSDYGCRLSTDFPQMPVLPFSVGAQMTIYRKTKMRDHLNEAIQLAHQADPNAQLTEVVGSGIAPDGTIDLSSPTDYQKEWVYGFYDSAGMGRFVAVTYWTPARGQMPPYVDPNAGNITNTDLIVNPTALPDSDVFTGVYGMTAGCMALTGNDSDAMVYSRDTTRNVDLVLLSSAGGTGMQFDSTMPNAPLLSCR